MGQKSGLWKALGLSSLILSIIIKVMHNIYLIHGINNPGIVMLSILAVFDFTILILSVIELIKLYWRDRKKSIYDEYYY